MCSYEGWLPSQQSFLGVHRWRPDTWHCFGSIGALAHSMLVSNLCYDSLQWNAGMLVSCEDWWSSILRAAWKQRASSSQRHQRQKSVSQFGRLQGWSTSNWWKLLQLLDWGSSFRVQYLTCKEFKQRHPEANSPMSVPPLAH